MQKKLRTLVVTALLAAIAVALYFLEFPLFPAAGHLKLDFSDIPALLGAVVFGPAWGVVIELLKNIIEMIFKGVVTQMGFGNLMNFAVGIAFIVPYAAVIRRARKKRGSAGWKALAAASAAGLATIVVVGLVMNFLVTPLFFRYFLNIEISTSMVMGIVGYATALNAIKGALLSAAGALLDSKPLRRALRTVEG